MLARFKLVIICLLLVLLSLQVFAQSSGIPIDASIDISDVSDSKSYPISVVSDSTLNIELSPTDGTMARARVLLLDEEGLILLESLADRDELEAGASLSVPLLAGNYQVIATLSENDDITSGTFNVSIDLVGDTVLDSFDVSEERLIEMGYPEFEARETVSWTIFAYYGADTDLEKAIIDDTNEFELAVEGDDMDIHVIVLLDRSPEYSDIDGDWDGTRLYKIGSDETPTMEDMIAIDSTPLHEFDELDMGDPETLAAFLTWGVQNYPAENYVVSFGSHGAGWRGVIVDQTDDNNSLTMPNLQQAFDTVRAETDFDSFELLINDACLMASIEYYDVMQDYFNISIGSAELVTDPALNMTQLTTALRESVGTEDTNLNEIGRELVDTYINVDSKDKSPLRNFTQAVTNLDRFEEVNIALDEFAEVVNENPRLHVPTLTQARANTYTYNRLFGATSQIDLGDFMGQIIFVSTDFEILIPAAQGVIDALNNARIYGNAGSFAIERTSYYNIYFPLNANGLNDYFGDSGLDSWEQMLINYFAYSRFEFWEVVSDDDIPFHPPQAPQINITRTIPEDAIASFNLPIAVDIEVQATNVSRGIFFVEQVIDDRTSIRLLANPLLQDVPIPTSFEPLSNQNVWRSGIDLRTVKWNAGAYELTDGHETNVEFLQQTFDDSGSFFLEGRYRRPEDENWLDVKVTFTADPNHEFDLRSSTFISINAQAGTFGVFEPEIGAQLQVFRTEVDPRDGDTDIEEDGHIYTIGEDGLGATLAPIDSGEYILRFRVEAFGQDPVETSKLVSVNNDNIDPDWRGQNFIGEFDFSASLPVWWGLDFSSSTGGLSVSTIGERPRMGNLYENIAVGVSDNLGLRDLDEVRERYINIGIPPEEAISFYETEVIDGREIQLFAYEVGVRVIHGFATYNQTKDTAMLFSIDERGGDPETAQRFFDNFLETVHFYDDIIYRDDSNWHYETIDIEQTVALPRGWLLVDEEMQWTSYRSNADNSTISFISVEDESVDVLTYAESVVVDIEFGDNIIRNYSGESHLWESIQYTVEYDGVNFVGRLYKTTRNNSSYFVRVETPEMTADDVYQSIFDPMISSIVIENKYYTHDMLDSYGIVFNIINPTLEANPKQPLRRSTLSGVEIAFLQSPLTDNQIEAYFVPEVILADAAVWFENYWANSGNTYHLRDIEFIEVAGQRAIEFNIELTIGSLSWTGRYFAVYSEQDDILYVIGARGLSTSPIDVDYLYLRDTMQFQFGNFDSFTSINNRPLFDPEYAIDVDVWRAASPMNFVRNRGFQVDWMYFADDQFQIEIYYLSGVETSNLQEGLGQFFGGFFANEDNFDALREITIDDGHPALEIEISFDNGPLSFLATYDEDRSRIILLGVTNYLTDDTNYLPIFERMKETFTIIPLD